MPLTLWNGLQNTVSRSLCRAYRKRQTFQTTLRQRNGRWHLDYKGRQFRFGEIWIKLAELFCTLQKARDEITKRWPGLLIISSWRVIMELFDRELQIGFRISLIGFTCNRIFTCEYSFNDGLLRLLTLTTSFFVHKWALFNVLYEVRWAPI